MKSTVALALALLATIVVANPMAANPLDGATIVQMSYIGPITPGGEDVTLNGTAQVSPYPARQRYFAAKVFIIRTGWLTQNIQDINAQIIKLNPVFNPKDFKDLTSRDLEKRNKILPPWCNPPGIGQSSEFAYNDNIAYLRGLPGRCFVNGGPRVCARIACTKGGGIFLCNDNSYSINPSCQYLATYAQDIVDRCPSNGVAHYLAGQEFDTDNYNVIVNAQNC